jgi:uncharacterized membrane protein YvbJ
MFCPKCGRDNLNEQKFCASCGTNLEAVSQMLLATRLISSRELTRGSINSPRGMRSTFLRTLRRMLRIER